MLEKRIESPILFSATTRIRRELADQRKQATISSPATAAGLRKSSAKLLRTCLVWRMVDLLSSAAGLAPILNPRKKTSYLALKYSYPVQRYEQTNWAILKI
jgi:hypothetical protein